MTILVFFNIDLAYDSFFLFWHALNWNIWNKLVLKS